MRILAAVRSGVASVVSLALIAAPVAAQDILLEKGAPAKSKPAAATRSGARDHWTKYNPPSTDELPAEAKVHIIQKGDTLWDLAQTYLGDPYLWPQIWEVNPYVTDPHWIYPGDPLVIPQPVLIADVAPPEPPEMESLVAPVPVAKYHDVYCGSYIVYLEKDYRKKGILGARDVDVDVRDTMLVPTYGDAKEVLVHNQKKQKESPKHHVTTAPKPVHETSTQAEPPSKSKSKSQPKTKTAKAEPPKKTKPAKPAKAPKPPKSEKIEYVLRKAPRIEAAEDYKVTQSEGEVVYINRGEIDGVKAGDEFQVVRPVREVFHPATGANMGIAMQMMGTLRVLCTQAKTATVVVTSNCETVEIGDLIRILEPIPIPLASEFKPTDRTCVSSGDRPSGYLVYNNNQREAVAEEDVFNIDLGSDAGVVPGDFLVLWRSSQIGDKIPPVILGDAVVLLVEKRTATAKVMSSYRAIEVGDRVRLR